MRLGCLDRITLYLLQFGRLGFKRLDQFLPHGVQLFPLSIPSRLR